MSNKAPNVIGDVDQEGDISITSFTLDEDQSGNLVVHEVVDTTPIESNALTEQPQEQETQDDTKIQDDSSIGLTRFDQTDLKMSEMNIENSLEEIIKKSET